MSTEGILPPPSQEEYLREIVRLLKLQVTYLVSGNRYMFDVTLRKMKKIEVGEDKLVSSQVSQEQRQELMDALSAMTKAVNKIV